MQTQYPLVPKEENPQGTQTALEPKPLKLEIACQGNKYELSLKQLGVNLAQNTCHAADLTVLPPVGGAFAGVMYGIYASGNGEPVLSPADFTKIRVVGGNTDIE